MENQHNNQEDEAQDLLMNKEWERQQIKSFTLFVNSHLRKKNVQIESILNDFRDGKKLLLLLEVMSGEPLPKCEKKDSRVHHVNNVNRCLEFIAKKGVKLAGIGSEEIVDGNVKMTLGMIWTIILRFAINVISDGSFSARDGLLLWAKRKTEGYKGVNISNFTTSFRDGLAFCALIHRHRPELLDYSSLKKENEIENLNLAFRLAEQHLDIPPMLDAEDMRYNPDEKSVMTYISCYYHAFSSSQQAENAVRRITKVMETDLENQKKKELYESLASGLLNWINKKIPEMEDRGSSNPTLDELLALRETMDAYKRGEKPPKADEKAKLESTHNTLRTRLHLLNRLEYVPPAGLSLKEINDRWAELEKQEKLKLDWLNLTLQRLEFLEHLLKKFLYKCEQQDNWMIGRFEQLNAKVEDLQLGEVIAAKKKTIALQNDIDARSCRIKTITSLYERLESLQYSNMPEIRSRHQGIITSWDSLKNACKMYTDRIIEREKFLMRADELNLQYSQKAPELKAFIEDSVEDLNDTYQAHSVVDVEALEKEHSAFVQSLPGAKAKLDELVKLDQEIKMLSDNPNPYTSVTSSEMQDRWVQLEGLSKKRTETLAREKAQQANNENLKARFAEKAEEVERFRITQLQNIQKVTVGLRGDALEDSIASLKQTAAAIDTYYSVELARLDSLNKEMQNAQIYFNPLTTHSIESIGTNYQHLMHTLSTSINEIENQILVRDSGTISEKQMREYRKSFDYFDRHHVNYLSLEEFRSFLVSLGFNVATDDKTGDKEFDRICARVDPEHGGQITFNNFLNFVALENQDTDTAEQVIESFSKLAGGKDYITPEVIRREFQPAQAEVILNNMAPSSAPDAPPGALDYRTFAATLYGETDL